MSAPKNPLADPKLKPTPGLNIRRARAGGFILAGKSLKQALISAGFAENTASKPTASGLTAETCIAEYAKLDKRFDPSTILAGTRRLAKRTIDAWNARPDSALTDKVGAVAIPRLIETIERYHGTVKPDGGDAVKRSFVERAEDVAEVIEEMRKRGIIGCTVNDDSRDAERSTETQSPPRMIGASQKGTPLP